jgi:hypothetical protein
MDRMMRLTSRMTTSRMTMGWMTTMTVLVMASGSLLAQNAPPANAQSAPPPSTQSAPPAPPASEGQAPGHARQGGCWQQAGISQATVQAHRQIMESTRTQVQAACSDPALTQQQRVLKIRQIHELARQQMATLVTPEQEQAMNACRAQRGEGPAMHGPGGMGGTGGAGECGMANGGTARQHAAPSTPQQRPQQPQQQPSEDQDPY